MRSSAVNGGSGVDVRAAAACRLGWVLVLVLGCNAFDEGGPHDGDPVLFGGSDRIEPRRVPSDNPPLIEPAVSEEEVAACLEVRGVSTLPEECALCACNEGPRAVMACNTTCFALLACVVELCPDDPSEVGCVVANCNAFIDAATQTTALGEVLTTVCDAQCRTPPEPMPVVPDAGSDRDSHDADDGGAQGDLCVADDDAGRDDDCIFFE